MANDKGQILLQNRSDRDEWGLPGGCQELGETFEDVIIREVKEETNLDIDKDIQAAKGELEKLDGELQALVEQEGIILGEYGKGLMQEVAKFEEDTSTEVEVPVPIVVPDLQEVI